MSAIFDCSDEIERERGLALAVAVLKRGGLAAFAAKRPPEFVGR